MVCPHADTLYLVYSCVRTIQLSTTHSGKYSSSHALFTHRRPNWLGGVCETPREYSETQSNW